MTSLAIVAFLVGFLGSIPVAGPVAVVVFRRAIEGRVASALATGWAAGIAEGLYAFAAAVGMGLLVEGRPWVARLSTALASVMLVVVGVGLWRAKTDAPPGGTSLPTGRRQGALLGFVLVLANPTIIATWSVVVTQLVAFGLYQTSAGAAAILAVSAGLGCAAWFTTLVAIVKRLRERATQAAIRWIQRGFAVAVCVLALYFAYSAVFPPS